MNSPSFDEAGNLTAASRERTAQAARRRERIRELRDSARRHYLFGIADFLAVANNQNLFGAEGWAHVICSPET